MESATSTTPETTAMLLMTERLNRAEVGPLSRFIATRRIPGDTWCSWDVIAHQLYGITGLSTSREGLIKWAHRYSIPTDTKRTDGERLRKQYLTALTVRNIPHD